MAAVFHPISVVTDNRDVDVHPMAADFYNMTATFHLMNVDGHKTSVDSHKTDVDMEKTPIDWHKSSFPRGGTLQNLPLLPELNNKMLRSELANHSFLIFF